jgi:STE24 endopeptidase
LLAAIQGTVALLVLLRWAAETALLSLNLRHAARAGSEVPEPLRERLPAETARRALAYTLARGRLALAHLAWDASLTLLLLFSGVLPWLDATLARRLPGEATRFAAFLLALSALASLASLPFSLWGTFVLEARFGFNRTTWRTWMADRAKGLAVSLALGVPLLYAAHAFMVATGPLWWLWLWAFLAAVQVVLLWLYPAVIAPLFNRFAPLPDGDLRSRLDALCRDTGFRTRGLFVMDASRRSAHSNAYFVGILRPRIVLYDTLLSSMTVEEGVAVLAHEIGHYRERHVLKRLGAGLLSTLATLAGLAWLVRWPPLFQAFGFAAPSWEAAVAVFALAGGAFTFFLAPLGAWWSRRHEVAADRFAVRHAGSPTALGTALVKLARENLGNLHPHPWYVRWHYTHPPLLERLAAIEAAAPGRAPDPPGGAAAAR